MHRSRTHGGQLILSRKWIPTSRSSAANWTPHGRAISRSAPTREEAEDALHQLRSNIPRLLSESSEKALWNTPEPPPPEPSPEPPPDDVVLPEEPSEPDPEPPPDADPPSESLPPDAELPPDPQPPPRPPAWDAIALLYRRRQTQTETCETIAEVLHSVPMRDFTRDRFRHPTGGLGRGSRLGWRSP